MGKLRRESAQNRNDAMYKSIKGQLQAQATLSRFLYY